MKGLHKGTICLLVLVLSVIWIVGCGAREPTEQAGWRPSPTPVKVDEQAADVAHAGPTALPPREPPSRAPMPTGTATPRVLETPSGPPPVDEVAASLENLPIDEFFDTSFRQLLRRDPQELTALGLSESLGLRNDQLTNLSDAYIRDTQKLEAAILDMLRTYERAGLTGEQQLSYDVYEWYLDNLVRGQAFMYHDYVLHHFLRSYQFELDNLFTEIQPLDDRCDAEDYISRLSQVDDQVDQLMEGLKLREERGVIPPRFILQLAKRDLTQYLQIRSADLAAIQPKSLRVYARFSEAIEQIADLSEEEKQAFRESAEREIQESFVPAYLVLRDYLDYLLPMATEEAGVWKLPNGDEYYAYLLRLETSTDLTPAEIHELGRAEITRIQAEMRRAFTELGYPEDQTLTRLLDRAANEGGLYDISTQEGKDRFIAAIEAIIEEADHRLDAAVDLRPKGKVVVIGGPTGGYYVSGAPDGSRPGSYHVSLMGNWRSRLFVPSAAYHEAIPGHHFQIALAQEANLPLFRNTVASNAYVEGWAMYAERLAWELGLYDDDPYGNIGRLYFELLRAVRLVADTGIHAMRWTQEEANAYMAETLGGSTDEVDRYVVIPAQATGYKIGMIKILELRQMAMDRLGDRFELKEFHNVLLGNGSLPLEILEQVVNDYVEAKLSP